jgi:hypothetical protein
MAGKGKRKYNVSEYTIRKKFMEMEGELENGSELDMFYKD